jgi:hypothetical protein
VGHVRRLSQHDDRAAERTVRLSDWLAWAFSSGHAADIVLLVIAAEFVWLVRARRWTVADAALRLLPGVLMMVAVRLALVDAPWPLIALTLAASFPIHLADLRRRGGPRIT